MGRLGVIVGSNAFSAGGGEIGAAAEAHGAAVLQRHGSGAYRLPHLIDHESNLRSLASGGCDHVLAISSVGSLDPALDVGGMICPDDFIALHLSASIFDDARAHSMPGFDRDWRAAVVSAWQATGGAALRDGGVYWQTIGPRFETPAEVRLIARHATVVGMTVASECVIARELGIAYAAVCIVDNLANGIGREPLSIEQVEDQRARNAAALRDSLGAVLPELA